MVSFLSSLETEPLYLVDGRSLNSSKWSFYLAVKRPKKRRENKLNHWENSPMVQSFSIWQKINLKK